MPDNIIIERLSGRLSCSSASCGAIYQIKAAPPKVPGICDVCGSKLIQRSDDKADVVAERLNVYKRQTEPLINYYRQQGILREIDGNRSQNEIYGDIIKSMQVN